MQGGDYSMFPPVHEKREEEGECSQAFSSSPARLSGPWVSLSLIGRGRSEQRPTQSRRPWPAGIPLPLPRPPTTTPPALCSRPLRAAVLASVRERAGPLASRLGQPWWGARGMGRGQAGF